MPLQPRFLDCFAGSGLVSEAVRPFFDVVWANDVSPKKAAVYTANHGPAHFHLGPIEEVRGTTLPEAEVSWASFPCQDLSLAGPQAGLRGRRSGLVREWLRLHDEMPRKPSLLVAENVVGLVASAGGANYRALHLELVRRGFKVGAVVVDAAEFLPQSRPRVFVIACRAGAALARFTRPGADWCHPQPVLAAAAGLPGWVFWKLPAPPATRRPGLAALVERDAPVDAPARPRRNLAMLAPRHRERLAARPPGPFSVFPGYKRTRAGGPVLELRFDDTAGCLRTPGGGSSRQLLVLRREGALATRLLTARETARLMGAPEGYRLPAGYNDAYKAMGDAVAVPVARFLAKELLAPLCRSLGRASTGRS